MLEQAAEPLATELRLTLFGGFQISRGEAPLTGFVSSKAQALLCYLACTGRAHTRAALAGLLWGDMPDSLAAGNLRKAISNLHQIAGPYVTITRHTVAFDHTSPYWLDVEVFETHLRAGAPEQNPELWQAAVGLYQGELLHGFYVRDAPAFEEWLLLERQRLRGLAIDALHQLSVYHANQRDYAVGLECARRLLAMEPWREEAHQLAMRLLANSGQRGAALAQYQACRRILWEELAAEPAPETIELYERIRDAALAPPNNLPPMPTSFVGRQDELAEIARLLDRPDCRLLSLVGMSGIGKTRLALEAAEAETQRFRHGVFWVPLSPMQASGFLVAALAEALGLTLHAGADPRSQLLSYLSEKRLLLLLDSFEHVLDETSLVADILARAADVKLMVTSTERLNLQGEWILPLAGLSVPPAQAERALEGYSAVQLFIERAHRAGVRLLWNASEMGSVARICQLVEGMPLAIELAAAWALATSCHEIANEIAHNRDFLSTTLRDVPERHQSMRAAFSYSWRLLSETERETFGRLAAFRNGFERTAAEHVAEAPLPVLSSLVDKSLLSWNSAGRYQVHDLLWQYASERLEQSQVVEQTRQRHLEYYLRLAEAADTQLHGPDQLAWLDRLEAEHDNVRAALVWALKRAAAHVPSASEAALNLAGALGLFWDLRGHFAEGRQWLAQALAFGPPASPYPELAAARSRALYWAGHLAKWQGDYRQAAELAEANLVLCRREGDGWRIAYALYLAGSVWNKQGELARAKEYLDESLILFRDVGARWGLAHTLGTLGNIARAQGRHAEAADLWDESLEIYRQLGDRRGIARSLNRMWHLPFNSGDYARTTALLEQAADLFRELKHRDGVAIILRHLGLVAQAQGDLSRARELFEESRHQFRELGDNDDLVYASWYLGRLELHEGNFARARTLLEEGRALAQGVGNKGLIASVSQTLATVAQRQGAEDIARTLLKESLDLALEAGEQDVISDGLTAIAEFAAAGEQPERAARLFGAAEALRSARNISLSPVIRGEHKRAVAAVRAQLDKTAFDAAWANGWAMNIEQAVAMATESVDK